jgi:hypothetical protein
VKKRALKKYLRGLGLGLKRATFSEENEDCGIYQWKSFPLDRPWDADYHLNLERAQHRACCDISQQLRFIAMTEFIVSHAADFNKDAFDELERWAHSPQASEWPTILKAAQATQLRASPVSPRRLRELTAEYGPINRSWLSPLIRSTLARMKQGSELLSSAPNLIGGQIENAADSTGALA